MDFYDSARWGLIPPGAAAAVYFDGRFAMTAEQARRFSKVRWITIAGGAAAAAHTGCIDYEFGNLAFEGGQLREWAVARKAMNCRARVYTDLSNAGAVHDKVGDLDNVVWWPAIYGPRLTAAQVVVKLAEFGVEVGEEKIWGLQYAGGPTAAYDTDALLGTW